MTLKIKLTNGKEVVEEFSRLTTEQWQSRTVYGKLWYPFRFLVQLMAWGVILLFVLVTEGRVLPRVHKNTDGLKNQ